MSSQLRLWQLQTLLFGFAAVMRGYAGEADRYQFREGEPLAYKTQVAVVVDTAGQSKYFEHFGKAKRKTNVTFDIEYQLLPIAHERWWKVRLVLDQVKRTTEHDGQADTAIFDRSKLKTQQLSVGDMLNLNVWDLGVAAQEKIEDEQEHAETSADDAAPVPAPPKAEKVRVPEDLFERPILTWFSSDGTLERFEDRTEMQEIMDGLDLKECIKLLIPPLPAGELKAGFTWTREEDVDLPAPPLKGEEYEPPKWQLTYTVKSLEQIGERLCARIAVRGRFARAGLWIPIAKEKRKYLVWTTMITKLEDRIDGEFVYDVADKVMRASTVRNSYNYSTVEARKIDNYRGQILNDVTVQTRITSALVESAENDAANNAVGHASNDTGRVATNTAFHGPEQTIEEHK
jgi:hypothetical protein